MNKLGIQTVPPLGFVASRVMLSVLLILPFSIKSLPKLTKNFLKLFPFSLLATSNIGLYIIGLSQTSASIAATMYTAVPLITLILSYFFYKEKIILRQSVGVTIGMMGTVLIAIIPLLRSNTFEFGNFTGNLIIFAVVIVFSFHTVLSRKIQKLFSPLEITSGFILTSAVILVPLALWEISVTASWIQELSLTTFALIFYMALVGTVGFYFLYQQSVRNASPLFASLILYLAPVVAVIMAVLILGEELTIEFIIGAVLVLTGVWLITSRQKKEVIVEEAKAGG